MPLTTHTENGSSPERPAMVGWYDPLQLIRTASEVVVSALFGRHADYRLIEALAAPGHTFDTIDARPDGEVWIDYVADLGDGWNSTYAVAYAIAQPQLSVRAPDGNDYRTERGSLLVFGGDAVYPVASRAEYKKRVVAPYDTALHHTNRPHPLVRAVPGNHDWYDSLVAFSRLFGSREWFAGWRAKQPCSYFAVKLPRGWWLLGTDVQLDSDMDEPQVAFFKATATQMQPGDRVILCNAEPHWIFAHIYGRADADYNENNLAFLEKKVLRRKVAVFLAGDLHHYRRHQAHDGRQKITAGGGGAFLHPTHGPDVSRLQGGFELKCSYPDPAVSRRLGWRNLLFPFLNPKFGMVSGPLYMLTVWAAQPQFAGLGIGQFSTAFSNAVRAALNTPVAAFWTLALFLGFWLFTDTHFKPYRLIGGTLHALAHVFAAFAIGWAATYFTVDFLHMAPDGGWQLLVAVVLMVAGGWIVGSIIMGVYLLISLNGFRRHSNEAFSSLGIQDWKHFLRLRIDAAGELTVYPIGIRRVPRRWKPREDPSPGPQLVPDDARATDPELIEAPVPVRARAANA